MRSLRCLMVLALVLTTGLDALAEQSVRIAVGRFRGPLSVAGPDMHVTGDDGTSYRPKGPVTLAPGPRGILWSGKPINSDILYVRSPSELTLRGHKYVQLLEVSYRSYKGRAELLVVHPIGLERYVTGIVSSELPKKWPYEALKAQAVAARTYAVWQKYRRLDLPYHMESSVLDQVYHGAERVHPEAVRAVQETAGIILTSHRRPAEAYFHSTCGGKTESAKEGWGNAIDYLPGSTCGFCRAASLYRWSHAATGAELKKRFARRFGDEVKEIKILSRTRTGRIKKVRLIGPKKKTTLTGGDFRRLIGYTKVWSTLITKIEKRGDSFVFTGRGAGHGVGMCQYGARGMALKGHTYDEMLDRYYPGAERTRMY